MPKFLNHIKSLVAIILIVLFSISTVVAVDNTGVDGKTLKAKKSEIASPEPGNEFNKTKKHEALDADSLKSAKKIAENAKKGADNQSKVKKSENSSPSIFSYNFVFYLMYKFKIADIFDISKEKNAINIPGESSLIANGKKLVNTMINKIID